MTALLGAAPAPRGGLAALLCCPTCGSRDLGDQTPAAEDPGWWAWMLCRTCGHEWRARS